MYGAAPRTFCPSREKGQKSSYPVNNQYIRNQSPYIENQNPYIRNQSPYIRNRLYFQASDIEMVYSFFYA